MTLEELQARCKALIANYEVPRSLEILEGLPVYGAGKVLKNELRELANHGAALTRTPRDDPMVTMASAAARRE